MYYSKILLKQKYVGMWITLVSFDTCLFDYLVLETLLDLGLTAVFCLRALVAIANACTSLVWP